MSKTKLAKDLERGDRILDEEGRILIVRDRPVKSMIKGEVMISHNGNPDWSSVSPNTEITLAD